jgi:hypothetical protein
MLEAKYERVAEEQLETLVAHSNAATVVNLESEPADREAPDL